MWIMTLQMSSDVYGIVQHDNLLKSLLCSHVHKARLDMHLLECVIVGVCSCSCV